MDRPILFNTEMVQAILEGRKTVTRRIIKPTPLGMTYENGCPARRPPVEPGDTLWVRETWKQATTGTAGPGLIDLFLYKADEPQDTTGMMVEDRWHPSIHMPRRAARIFLKVTAVRTERLQDITMDEIRKEGLVPSCAMCHFNAAQKTGEIECTKGVVTSADCGLENLFPDLGFRGLWNSTIKEADLPRYGWDANPWVWVIEFERMEAQP